MIVLAVLATLAAIVWSFMVIFANGMRTAPGLRDGRLSMTFVWVTAAVLWLAWWFN